MKGKIQNCPGCDRLVNRLVNPDHCPNCQRKFRRGFGIAGQ